MFVKKAKGAHIWDVDGNKYIDYRLGFGPVVLGHAYRRVETRVRHAARKGSVYALDTHAEIDVAKKLVENVPCAEMVRFSNTGTEATMHAIRIARAFTGREKILKFEGHFHGAHDYLLWSIEPPFDTPRKPHDQPRVAASTGIPRAIKNLVFVERFNDFHGVEKTMRAHGDSIAAVILEPVMGNATVIPPRPGFLEHLRTLCTEHGTILIFDEVKTGFRIGMGGAQEAYKVTPDMATLSKALGNGYPIAAIVGRRDIMESVGPKKVAHGGTFSGNPISLAAANATLDELKEKKVFEWLDSYGKRLFKGLRNVFEDANVDAVIQGFPSMFQVVFTKMDRVNEFRDLRHADFNLFSKLQFELLKEGVMIDDDGEEPMFTSYSHSLADLHKTVDSFEAALERALVPRSVMPVEDVEKKVYRPRA
jgi:glutamate-1-semialdehyde 2,1-aminomutase